MRGAGDGVFEIDVMAGESKPAKDLLIRVARASFPPRVCKQPGGNVGIWNGRPLDEDERVVPVHPRCLHDSTGRVETVDEIGAGRRQPFTLDAAGDADAAVGFACARGRLDIERDEELPFQHAALGPEDRSGARREPYTR